MASEKTTITFQISKDKKDRWTDWLENEQSQYDSNLSQFIRLSVENMIHQTETGSPDTSASVEDGTVEKIEDRLTDIDNRMREMANSMKEIDTSNRSNYVIDQLQQDIYKNLPSIDMENDESRNSMTESPEEHARTVDELSEIIDADRYLIANTLEELTQSTGRVYRISKNNTYYYWRDE